MFVLVALYVSFGVGFSGNYTTGMILDKTNFNFESDCQRAVEILEKKYPSKAEAGSIKPALVQATCIYVR